jgi:hypothetical protein
MLPHTCKFTFFSASHLRYCSNSVVRRREFIKLPHISCNGLTLPQANYSTLDSSINNSVHPDDQSTKKNRGDNGSYVAPDIVSLDRPTLSRDQLFHTNTQPSAQNIEQSGISPSYGCADAGGDGGDD